MNAFAQTPRRWDIFCTVIDNFGDIGICWRLSRQLVTDHRQAVRLWVDDLHSFRRICPDINTSVARQSCQGVDVCVWSRPLPALAPADIPDIVIEAFACTIPLEYLQLMAQKPVKPLWFNMEYLSAENWVGGCHAQHSPHPQLKLQKTFWFPGFTGDTGGLLREQSLMDERDAFINSQQAQNRFWQALHLPAKEPGEMRISMFGYDMPSYEITADDNPGPENPLQELVTLWSQSPTPISVCAAEGKLAQQWVKAMHGKHRTGMLSLYVLPFLEQSLYDHLLWACDINFVRGEDSFVRAQWAGKPFVWHIYRQEDNVHFTKLEAFLSRYKGHFSGTVQAPLEAFWLAWNRGENIAGTWPAFAQERENIQIQNAGWTKNLQKQGDFISNMMLYCQKYL